MKRARAFLFWLHLGLGLGAGSVIAITVFTGAMMAFEKQVISWAEGDLRTIPAPPAGAMPLPIADLLKAALEKSPDLHPATVTVFADPTQAVILSSGRTNTFYANPYTGEIKPQAAPAVREFFQLMLRWHRWLGVKPSSRHSGGGGGQSTGAGESVPGSGVAVETSSTGKIQESAGRLREIASTVVGGATAVLLTLCLTGLWLWWPRRWSLASLRSTSWFNLRLTGRAREWNWHNAIGLWSVPVLLLMSFTGLVISFRSFATFVYGEPVTPQRITVQKPHPDSHPLGPDSFKAAAAREVPDWTSMIIRLGGGRQRGDRRMRSDAVVRTGGNPENRRRGGESGEPEAMTVLVRTPDAWPPTPVQLEFNPFTAELLSREEFGSQGFRRSLRQINRLLHTGEAWGIPGQALALGGCIGGLLLIYTGFALSWRRFMSRPKSASASSTVLTHSNNAKLFQTTR